MRTRKLPSVKLNAGLLWIRRVQTPVFTNVWLKGLCLPFLPTETRPYVISQGCTRPFFPSIFLISLSLRPSSSLSSLRLPHSFLTFRAPSIAFHLLICLAHDAKSLTVLAISLSSILSHLIDKKKKNSEAARAVISRTFGGGTVQTLEVFRSHFPRNVLTSLSLNHAAFPDLTSQAGHQTLMS